MKRKAIYLGAVVAVIALVVTFFALRRKGANENVSASTTSATAQASPPNIVSAPGRIEPISEEIEVGSELSGILRAVLVEEGDEVKRGQILAVLENDDYRAKIRTAESGRAAAEAARASAEARLVGAGAALRRTINGARIEERREARATVTQAEAVLRNLIVELERRQMLHREGDISREELDRATRDVEVARGRVSELQERSAFVSADAREEDKARDMAAVELARTQIREATAQIAEAQARTEEARARLEKTFIRAPLNGVVLRKRLNVGESITPESPNPSVFTIANTKTLRVRVDVDETDVGHIRTGQQAYVTADAYGGRRFTGRVVKIGQVLGKKNIRTEEPTERVDTKILETLVELDGGQRLPTGLRVDAFIIVGDSDSAMNTLQDARVVR